MEPIQTGMSGAAVEDIQDRLASLGYTIDQEERSEGLFGKSTAKAVARFRLDHDLSLGQEVDISTWAVLVDECYQMGDRTLYLRLPNFHGRDVRDLQRALNILGFSCGETDGYYGVHTEAAVKQFQESVGELADGMAFPDTFAAIMRLHHVWAGKPAAGPHPMGGMGFARAANVLERVKISITGEDPISRNIAGRIWNLASATSDDSGISLVGRAKDVDPGDEALIILSADPLPSGKRMANLMMDDVETLPRRIRSAIKSSRTKVPTIRIELPHALDYDGTFTTGDAQTYAVMLLDAICTALDD